MRAGPSAPPAHWPSRLDPAVRIVVGWMRGEGAHTGLHTSCHCQPPAGDQTHLGCGGCEPPPRSGEAAFAALTTPLPSIVSWGCPCEVTFDFLASTEMANTSSHGTIARVVGACLLGIGAWAVVEEASRGPRHMSALQESFVLEPVGSAAVRVFPSRQMALAEKYRESMLFGGKGKATTGSRVDGRPTVPGLETDCLPGVLGSDCSPAQEDGAWSPDAMAYLDSQTGGSHSNNMQKIQDAIDAGYAARDKFLADCLKDPDVCTGRKTDTSTAARMAGKYGDTPTWGARAHPFNPEQGADFGEFNNDGHWNHITLPAGVKGDGTVVSDSYYADALNKDAPPAEAWNTYS